MPKLSVPVFVNTDWAAAGRKGLPLKMVISGPKVKLGWAAYVFLESAHVACTNPSRTGENV